MKAILIYGDSISLEFLEKTIRQLKGIEILDSFSDPYKALEFIKKEEINIIFLNMNMKSHNGVELAQKYIKERPDLNIAFFTVQPQYGKDIYKINYILKPFKDKRLEKIIKDLKEKNKYNEGLNLNKKENYIEIKSFGNFEIFNREKKTIAWRTQKTKELFIFLWLQGERPVPRDIIIEKIFPNRELERANSIFHTTIYQLRKGLENLGYPNGIIYKNEGYYLNLPITSDIKELKDILAKNKLGKRDIKRVFDLYRGGLLEEESYPWIINDQENIKEEIFNKLEIYVKEAFEKKELDENLKIAIDTLLKVAPLRECGIKYMIIYYGNKNM